MAEQKIEFRKVREFGENLNDTFVFIKQNFKLLIQSVFAICGVFMLAQAIFHGIYQSQTFGVLSSVFKGKNIGSNYLENTFTIEYFMTFLFLFLTYVSVQVTIGAYIKYYNENNEQKPGIDEVWAIFKKYFFRILLYNIPITFLIALGYLFCILPGIYLWVVFVPFSYILMIEDLPFGAAFNRCFDLVRENFWMSFVTYLVAYLVYSFGSGAISLVVSLVIGLAAYFSTNNIGATVGIVTSFLNIFSFVFYIIYLISVAFNYFSLVEKRDGTGILGRIDTIGDKGDKFSNIEEQY